MIFVNFKTYQKGTGTAAVSLAKILEEVSNQTRVRIIPVVQTADLREVVASVKSSVWVQHVDSAEFGAHTGSTIAEAVKEDGAEGTFLNHSEHKFDSFENLQKAVERAKAASLSTLVFAANPEELNKIISLTPNFVSYEPPELVGSKTTSVAESQPEIISKAVEIAKSISLPLIVGAGIKSAEDVKKSLELGAVGVAVASSIVDSDNPRAEVMKLVEGFK